MLAKTRIGWTATALSFIVGIHALHAQETAPSALQPPAGYTVAFTAKASGVQIYKSMAENGAALKWTFEAPLAELSGPGQTIHHYAGPAWEAADGSRIVRDTNTPVVTIPAKQAAADIPWLLIKVTADPMPGLLSNIGYVQRVSTSGGVAPATPPVREGTTVGVPYTATYVFYAKSH
jgi:hypothetical protein